MQYTLGVLALLLAVEAQTASLRAFGDKETGFSIELPPQWVPQKPGGSPSDTVVFAGPDKSNAAVGVHPVAFAGPAMSEGQLEGIATTVLSLPAERGGSPVLSERVPLLGGASWRCSGFRTGPGNARVYTYVRLVSRPGLTIMAIATAPEGDKQAVTQATAIADSVTWQMSQGTVPGNDGGSGLVRFTNPDTGFSMPIPSTFKRAETGKTTCWIGRKGTPHEGATLNLFTFPRSRRGCSSVAVFSRLVQNGLEKRGARIYETQKITVGGMPGHAFSVRLRRDEKDYEYRHILVENKEHLVWLSFVWAAETPPKDIEGPIVNLLAGIQADS